MPDQDEIRPQWRKATNVPDVGVYIWTLRVVGVRSRDPGTAKPYLLLKLQILDGPYLGFEFDWRMYYSVAAEGWCRYFLKKFGYPPEHLDREDPTIKMSVMSGLSGKARVEVTVTTEGDSQYMNFDMKGFERVGETELEEKMEKQAKAREAELDFGTASEATPQDLPDVDIYADVREQQGNAEFDAQARADQERLAKQQLDALDNAYLDGVDPPLEVGW